MKSLRITSEKNVIASSYYPTDHSNVSGRVLITPPAPSADFLYLSLCFDESKGTDGDVIHFRVKCDDNNVYETSLNAPAGGFKNGNYYYTASPIPVTYRYMEELPEITWTSVKDRQIKEPDEDNLFTIYGPGDTEPIELSMTGTCSGLYEFNFKNDATIHLSDFKATLFGSYFIFWSRNNTITLDVNGSNQFSCPYYDACIQGKSVKLMGDGTLTLIANDREHKFCGIYSDDTYSPYKGTSHHTTTDELDVTAELAALRDFRVPERETGEGLCPGGIPQGGIHGVSQGALLHLSAEIPPNCSRLLNKEVFVDGSVRSLQVLKVTVPV